MKAILEAPDDLHNVCQTENENDNTYAAWLNNAVYCCGNVQDDDDKFKIYVKGLLQVLKTILQRLINETPRSD